MSVLPITQAAKADTINVPREAPIAMPTATYTFAESIKAGLSHLLTLRVRV